MTDGSLVTSKYECTDEQLTEMIGLLDSAPNCNSLYFDQGSNNATLFVVYDRLALTEADNQVLSIIALSYNQSSVSSN